MEGGGEPRRLLGSDQHQIPRLRAGGEADLVDLIRAENWTLLAACLHRRSVIKFNIYCVIG